MKAEKNFHDLAVLAADKDMKFTLLSVLNRHKALSIKKLEFKVFTHPQHDPGCYNQGIDYLEDIKARNIYRHAILIFDHDGCGAEEKTREIIESEVEKNMAVKWGNRAAVICIDPELENWIWSDSPHVDRALGWKGKKEPEQPLRTWLKKEGYLTGGTAKPKEPKEAMDKALICAPNRNPWSSSIFGQIAEKVSLEICSDPSFNKLKKKLREWFPCTPH